MDDVVECSTVSRLIMGRLFLIPGSWATRREVNPPAGREPRQELMYIKQIVHIYVTGADSFYVKFQVCKFSFRQLNALVTNNTVKIRRARFREVLGAYAPGARAQRLCHLRIPRIGVHGTWPWSPVDMRDCTGTFRALHLASTQGETLTFTYR